MPSKKPLPKIKAISFFAPHWELVYLGHLALDGFGVKTRKDDKYRHRGLVLCYTSKEAHVGPMHSYGFRNEDIPRGIVGCAMVVDVRELTHDDEEQLFRGYNNLFNATPKQFKQALNDIDSIYGMDYGYFIKPFHRFATPFVPPIQHMFGPIGAIPLYPEIECQLPDWARNEVRKVA